jgi:hypothetical protein
VLTAVGETAAAPPETGRVASDGGEEDEEEGDRKGWETVGRHGRDRVWRLRV